MRDVQRAAAHLRIAGRGQERAREHHGCDRADEQDRQLAMEVEAPRRTAQPYLTAVTGQFAPLFSERQLDASVFAPLRALVKLSESLAACA